jgi:hypothetical protein
MLCINDFGSNHFRVSLAKESGFGRFAGIEGLRACCLERAIVTDRIPGIHVHSPPIDIRIDINKGMPFGASLIQLLPMRVSAAACHTLGSQMATVGSKYLEFSKTWIEMRTARSAVTSTSNRPTDVPICLSIVRYSLVG